MDFDSIDFQKLFNKKVIVKGIIIFLLITVSTFIFLFVKNEGASNLEIWKRIKPSFLLFSFFFLALDLYIGGLRNHIFFYRNYPNLSQIVCIRANLACLFMGSATPSQTGGGPTQWYIWYRAGIKVKDIVKASFFNFISTIIFFPISAGIAFFVLQDKIPSGITLPLIKIGFTVFVLFGVLFLTILYSPKILPIIFHGVSKIINLFTKKYIYKIRRSIVKTLRKLYEYRKSFIETAKKEPELLLFSILLTIILYFNKFAFAYFISLAFDITPQFWDIIFVMTLGYMLLYFAPSPGGSGIAEISIASMLSSFMSGEYAASVTLFHRSFLIFIPAIIGGIIVIREINRHTVGSELENK